jgi:uncharacterized heparinase superfamily protein
MHGKEPTISKLEQLRLFFDTCLRLPKRQLAHRFIHEWWQPARPAEQPAAMKSRRAVTKPLTRMRSWRTDGAFTFLNQAGRCDDAASWQDRSRGLLWAYNLHYFADLLADDAPYRRAQHVALMERWRVDNPAAHGIGWMPYPCSLRIANWIKWHDWIGPLPRTVVQSLAQQAAWLEKRCEYHLRGNHLLVNAKALCMAGMTIDTNAASRWLERGLKILRTEVPAQVLADGGHCERSPMYHALVLEDILDLLNIAAGSDTAAARELERILQPRIPPMLKWLRGTTHPDGQIAFFNDAAFEIAPTLARLEDYATRVLGSIAPPKATIRHEPRCIEFSDSGFIRLERGDWTAIVDVGSVGASEQPAHAHADSLSIEVSFGNQRVFVNSGVSTYEAGSDRMYERGTAAHNCVQLDGVDSSEVWSSFRVARRARTTVLTTVLDAPCVRVRASHDGYRRLPGRPVVFREVRLSNDEFHIQDCVCGGSPYCVSRLHLHPAVRVERIGDGANEIRLHLGHETCLVLRHTATNATVIASSWRPEFGVKAATSCLEFEVPRDGLLISVSIRSKVLSSCASV